MPPFHRSLHSCGSAAAGRTWIVLFQQCGFSLKECVGLLCEKNFSWGDTTHMSTHPRQGAHNRPKYGYHQSSVCFIGVTYGNMGEGLLIGAEMTDSCI